MEYVNCTFESPIHVAASITRGIAAISNVPEAERLTIQNSVVGKLPNVSIINVQQMIGRIFDITNQISWAIRVMAYLSIMAGLVVLYLAISFGIASELGTGPIELVMLGLADRGIRLQVARWGIEAVLLATGIALGGQFGVATIIFRGEFSQLLDMHFNRGDLWVFSAMVVWAAYTLLLKRRPDDLEPLPFLAVTVFVGALANLPFELFQQLGSCTFPICP